MTPPVLDYPAARPNGLPPPMGLRRLVPSRQAARLVVLGLAVTAASVASAGRWFPRTSRGIGCVGDSSVAQNLAILRNAIDLYHVEHGERFPAATGSISVADLLTKYTNADGTKVSDKRDDGPDRLVYGPYLRKVPPASVGPARGRNTIGPTAAPGIAWIYDPATGNVTANATGKDPAGRAYSAY